jgi:phenylacetate-CoA ligase
MGHLPDYAVLDSKLERLPRPMLRELQSRRLRAMVGYVHEETPFWRRKLHAAGLTPDDIRGPEDLPRLPFCTREELQADQAAHPPFGSYVGSDPSRWVKYMATSGTTGVPLQRVFSARDWGYVLDRFQRNPVVGPGDVVVILGPVDALMGPTAASEGMARAGALVVQAGLYDTKSKVQLIRDLRPTVVSGTASYLLHLLEVAAELGVGLRELGIRAISSVGEPGAAVPATRKRLGEGWGAFVNDGYGLTEIFPLGGGCLHSTALHIPDDLVVTEIVEPESGRPLPPGVPGEVVYTNLIGDTQPLLRYRSRDIARLAPEEPCACGFTGTRLSDSIEGRVDDMLWFRGANVFPSAVEAVVRGFPELSHEYRIVVEGDRALPTLTVRVEAQRELAPSERSALEGRVAEALAAAIRVRPRLELCPPGTLPRAEARGKMRRVLDRRTG